MGIKINDIADTKVKKYVGNLPTININEEVHILAHVR